MLDCEGLYLPDLAESFVDKGASAYLAGDGSVAFDYGDEATLYLIRQLCSERVTIKQVMHSTMDVIGPYPKYEAELKYYQLVTVDKTLDGLIRWYLALKITQEIEVKEIAGKAEDASNCEPPAD